MAYSDPEDKRRYYREHKQKYLQRANTARKAKRDLLVSIKENAPCADCKESHPYYVMQFDHVSGKKLFNISRVNDFGFTKLSDEIDKCEVVCANCHAARTFKRAHCVL